jgi:hypothetical protein
MEATARPTEARILTIVATLVAAVHMADFIFYGRHAHDALDGIGMALIAHSAWHGGFGKAAAATTAAGQEKAGATTGSAARATARARTASVLGVSLVIASIFAKYALRGVAWA